VLTLLVGPLAALALLLVPPDALAARWLWPVSGPVIARFHYGPDPFARGQRRGIDIAAPAGTPIRSACSGRVRFAGAIGTSGRTVSVACGPFVASYLHLDEIATRRGSHLTAGERIGTVGPSPLYLGARRIGSRWGYVDPLRLLGDERRVPRRVAPPLGAAPRPGRGRAPAPTQAPRLIGRAPVAGLPLGVLWLPVGSALALAAILAPLTALRVRRRRAAWRSARVVALGADAVNGER
jgi:Peptidase family M23